ncbi:toprim domain-containing protein [Candidatus Dependentiae bacterium]|nr:toprim domain-containing protein [Candidatus Dependentiae bacterium]
MNLLQFYQTAVLPYLDKKLVFNDLNLVDKGDHYTADCPQCKKHEAFLYKNSEILSCNRKNSCGYFVSLTAYINDGRVPRGREFVQVVKKLCQIAGVEFIKPNYTEEVRVPLVQNSRQKLLQDFLALTKESLLSDEAALAREYLEQRGWTQEQLSEYEFGYYRGAEYIKEQLEQKGYLASDILNSGIYRSDWHERIVYPWRDLAGIIINFWARHIIGDTEGKKYLLMSSEKGGSKAVPFGWQWLTGNSIIIVEGFFDVLALKAHSITNALATASAGISQEQMQALVHRNPQSITLCYDNDEAGCKATEHDIDKLINTDMQLFVMPPHYLGGAKDPDEFCSIYGSGAFQELIALRIHALRYKAQCMVSRHKKEAQWTDAELVALIDEALAFIGTITNKARKADLDFLWQELAYETGRTLENLHEHSKNFIQKQEQQKRVQQLLQLAHQGSPEVIDAYILKEAEKLTRPVEFDPILQVPRLSKLLDEHESILLSYRGKEFIGLPQRSLPLLDDYLSGMRNLIVIAASPALHKTGLGIQNALDILIHNPEACLVYVTFEMTTQEVIYAMRCYLAGISLTTLLFGSDKQAKSGVYFTQEEQHQLEASAKLLKTLGERITILDLQTCPLITAEVILTQVGKLKAQTGAARSVIVIDSLEQWPLPSDLEFVVATDKQLNTWRMNQAKKLKQLQFNNPVIVLCQAPALVHIKNTQQELDTLAHLSSSDFLLILRPLSDIELADAWLTYKGYSLGLEYQEHTSRVQDYLNKRQCSIYVLQVVKANNGMACDDILVTFSSKTSKFEQLNWALQD